jgi:hypothetical protein
MQTAATWNFAPADDNHLAELLKLFGCADVVASVDADVFGRRTGELIRRGISTKAPLQTEEALSRNLEKEPALSTELQSAPERISLLDVIHHSPRYDRLTLLVTAAASASLLLAGAAFLDS